MQSFLSHSGMFPSAGAGPSRLPGNVPMERASAVPSTLEEPLWENQEHAVLCVITPAKCWVICSD